MHIQPKSGRIFLGRLQAGDDLLPALTEFCNNNNIKLGALSVIGAVTQAKLGYFDQENKQYTGCVELDKKLEIASCMGNISLKDGGIMVHAHIVLADWEGKATVRVQYLYWRHLRVQMRGPAIEPTPQGRSTCWQRWHGVLHVRVRTFQPRACQPDCQRAR